MMSDGRPHGWTSTKPLAPDSADLIADDITVPIIPKRADEFACSNCFLIQHISRLATSMVNRSAPTARSETKERPCPTTRRSQRLTTRWR